ncbi:hypothetical protein GCM10020001_087450 [Nonomuraea salmonea]
MVAAYTFAPWVRERAAAWRWGGAMMSSTQTGSPGNMERKAAFSSVRGA